MSKTEKLLSELIALPSVNPAFLAPGNPIAGEQRVADFLASTAACAKLDVGFQKVLTGRSNLIVRLSPAGKIRQRILLARALYRKPRILFLDEGTAHLDPAMEQQVNAEIGKLAITRVIIAHRPQTVAAADRVLVDGSEQVFTKLDPNGTWFIGIFNTGTASRQTFRVRLSQLGIDRPVRVTDLWTGRSAGTVSGTYTTAVAPGGVTLISAAPA